MDWCVPQRCGRRAPRFLMMMMRALCTPLRRPACPGVVDGVHVLRERLHCSARQPHRPLPATVLHQPLVAGVQAPALPERLPHLDKAEGGWCSTLSKRLQEPAALPPRAAPDGLELPRHELETRRWLPTISASRAQRTAPFPKAWNRNEVVLGSCAELYRTLCCIN